jgi:hypothetical protein
VWKRRRRQIDKTFAERKAERIERRQEGETFFLGAITEVAPGPESKTKNFEEAGFPTRSQFKKQVRMHKKPNRARPQPRPKYRAKKVAES